MLALFMKCSGACYEHSPLHEAHKSIPLKLAAHVELGFNDLGLAVDELGLHVCRAKGAL